MSIQKQVSDQLKKDGVLLNDDDIPNIVRFLNSLAKIEYEVYRQQKLNPIYGQSKEPQEIGFNIQKLAA